MVEYSQPDGRARVISYHAPGPLYAYIVAEAQRRGITRNKAITEIIAEHEEAAAKREARRKK